MNDYRAYVENDYNSLYHYGIRGQKWGIRRYQNPDGSLTPEGRARYLNPDGSLNERGRKELGRQYLKDRKYAGRVAGGLLGTAAAAYYAKENASAKRWNNIVQPEINKIRQQHPETKFYTSATLVKNGENVLEKIEKIPKNSQEAEKLKKAGYIISDHRGGWGPKGYDVYTKESNKLSKYAREIKDDAPTIKRYLDSGNYHVVPNRHFETVNLKNPIAEKKISDLINNEKTHSKKIVAAVLAAGIGATAVGLYLHHKGVQKRKAEVERMLMGSDKSDSSTTKRTKDDWKNMSDKEFRQKYGVSKDKYAKRVAKYRDPSEKAPLARLGRLLSGKKTGNSQRGFAGDAPSLKDIRTQQNKQGRVPTIKETVERQNSFGRAPSIIPNFVTDNFSKAESMALSRGGDYYVAYDPNLGGYIVRRRGR